MNPSLQPLVDYIRAHREHGSDENTIWTELLNAGWEYADIQTAFYAVDQPPASQQPYEQPDVPYSDPADVRLAPQKYTIWAAVLDVIKAAAINWHLILVCLVIATVCFYAVDFILNAFRFTVFLLAFGAVDLKKLALLVSIVSLLTLVGTAIAMTITAIALQDGLEGRRSGLWSSLRLAFRSFLKVLLGVGVLSAVAVGPILLIGIVFTAYMAAPGLPKEGVIAGVIGIVLWICAFVWILLVCLRYVLIPFIVFTEPQVKLLKTPTRSYALLKGGGQWFLFKGFVILLAINIVSFVLTKDKILTETSSYVFLFASAFVSVMSYAVLYALYRNRLYIKG